MARKSQTFEERLEQLEASLRAAQAAERAQRQRADGLEAASRAMWQRTLDATAWRRGEK
jgi:hypothetical protein